RRSPRSVSDSSPERSACCRRTTRKDAVSPGTFPAKYLIDCRRRRRGPRHERAQERQREKRPSKDHRMASPNLPPSWNMRIIDLQTSTIVQWSRPEKLPRMVTRTPIAVIAEVSDDGKTTSPPD